MDNRMCPRLPYRQDSKRQICLGAFLWGNGLVPMSLPELFGRSNQPGTPFVRVGSLIHWKAPTVLVSGWPAQNGESPALRRDVYNRTPWKTGQCRRFAIVTERKILAAVRHLVEYR